jgi:hypothetical protein
MTPANIPWRILGLLAGLIVLIAVPALLVRSCDRHRSEAAQSRVERGQTGALSKSAADAVGTVAASGEASAASEALTRSNQQEIRNAPGANAPVNPAARDAGLRSLCRRAAYRDSERCRLLQPRP